MFKYYWNYTHFLDFENYYITSMFVMIDKFRKQHEQHHILPIKSFEKEFYIYPTSIFLTRAERQSLINILVLCVYEMLLIFILLSVLNYFTETSQQHKLRWSMMDLKHGFYSHNIKVINLSPVHDIDYMTLLYWLYLVILIFVINQIYCDRLMALVCSLVFPMVEESRIMALYHEITFKRQEIFDINMKLLQDEIMNREELEDESPFIKFRLWNLFKRMMFSIGRAFIWVLHKLYITCDICKDYGKDRIQCWVDQSWLQG